MAHGDVSADRTEGLHVAEDSADPRQGHSYIDDDRQLLEWSDAEEDESELDERDFDDLRVEDEDWEMAERGTHLPLIP
jgi:RIO kinase 1